MAKHKCKNCGTVFIVNIKTSGPFGTTTSCPHCGSTWTEYIGPGLTPDLHSPYRLRC